VPGTRTCPEWAPRSSEECGGRCALGLERQPVDTVRARDHERPCNRAATDDLVMATPILLDCDPGHDDAIAILLALASPEVELVGVTTVAGNQTLEKVTVNALRVLELVGRDDVPVAPGAGRPLVREPFVADYVHGETGMDGPQLEPPRGAPADVHAVDLLAERIRALAGHVTLVATGPLTNVALLLALHASAPPDRIVLMGGAVAEGNVTPAAEFNIWADPEAAQRVFTSGIDVTMVGLDVTHRAPMRREHAERVRASGRVGRFVAELWDFFSRFHAEVYGTEDSPVHDALAVAHVIRPDLLKTRFVNVEVDCESKLCRGRTVADVWRRTDRPPNAHVAVDVDGDAFGELLVERISALDE
jgi:inosine-uridine nucleoside N-ribohydrolase